MEILDLLKVVAGLPFWVMYVLGLVKQFIEQPQQVKAKQLGELLLYVILAIVLSPCACCIFLIQGVAG